MNEEGENALTLAIANSHVACVRYLVTKGLDINKIIEVTCHVMTSNLLRLPGKKLFSNLKKPKMPWKRMKKTKVRRDEIVCLITKLVMKTMNKRPKC